MRHPGDPLSVRACVVKGLLDQQIAAVSERTPLRKRKDEGYKEKVAVLQERMRKLDEVCPVE